MQRRLLVLVCLAALIGSRATTHDSATGEPTEISVPVGGGWEARAACDQSAANGTWNFTVVGVTGKISQLDVQVYRRAHPTLVSGEPRVCASFPDPYDRPQQVCAGSEPGSVESAGSVRMNRPKVGSQAGLLLDTATYCVRAVVMGKGSVTVSIQHP